MPVFCGIMFAILGFFILLSLPSIFFTVKQQTRAIIERFGKFVRINRPGLNVKYPWIERIAGRLSVRIQELNVEVKTKTSDDVFVTLIIAVQYFVMEEDAKVRDAFYKLSNPRAQIESYIYDVVRARVPHLELDDVFRKKNDIAEDVKDKLELTMNDYGYGIVAALVNDMRPDAKVEDAMNEVNRQARLRKAAQEKGEADKILVVKAAEAEAESKKLQGEGIAAQRLAIANGLKDAVEACKEAGVGVEDATQMVLLTQYLDTIKEVGLNSRSNTIFLSHNPGTLKSLGDEIAQGVMIGRQVPEEREQIDSEKK